MPNSQSSGTLGKGGTTTLLKVLVRKEKGSEERVSQYGCVNRFVSLFSWCVLPLHIHAFCDSLYQGFKQIGPKEKHKIILQENPHLLAMVKHHQQYYDKMYQLRLRWS